jgi:ABC-type phosphate transport system substrate-binding protein
MWTTTRFLLTWTILAGLNASPGDIAVIVHPSVPVTNMSFSEMRQVLLGDRQYWGSSLKVTLLVRAPAARERDVLLKTVYQMSEAQFRQYWIGKVFRAEAASAPLVVNSDEETARLVSSTPGSVAFIDADHVPKGVKVIKIDGKSAGEAGYKLK